MTAPALTFDQSEDTGILRVTGRLVTEKLGAVEEAFASAASRQGKLQMDLGSLEALDTGGAWMIAHLKSQLEKSGAQVELVGLTPEWRALLRTVENAIPPEEEIDGSERGLVAWVAGIGERTTEAGKSALSLIAFLGEVLYHLGRTILRPWRLRAIALVSQMEETGLKAIPIVVMMSFLIGIVLSFQGASQLQQFGAEVFVVDLIAISILRELGILLTAIIVAGRSGAAFTASIGSMKVREEIDAMRALSLDPIEVLVLPRVIALTIMLPVLGFIANLSGLFGGALMSWVELGVSPGMFITRLHDNTDIWHLAIGMIKAPFFAVIIAVVACWQGFQVRGSSESVGQRTTSSVVQSIFLVIAADAMFSIFFAELGV
jgi:phospholipid/cholesterol/gamma-HCH transport system permease protein